jgi:hypothetical protein
VLHWRQAFKLPNNLLRLAGQSLREEYERFFDERFVASLVLMVAFWIVCIVAWIQKIAGHNPDPRFWTLLSFCVTAYGGLQIFRLRPQLRRLHLRKPGERRVAQILERMRSKGFVILNDLPAGAFKTGHVIVGPSGVYIIETKGWDAFGSRVIERCDDELLLSGRVRDERALQQTREAARAIQLALKERLREHRPVKGVLVFSGDWTIQCRADHFDVDVVAAEELEDYFDEQQPKLTGKEIANIYSHLERVEG